MITNYDSTVMRVNEYYVGLNTVVMSSKRAKDEMKNILYCDL